MTSSKSRTYAFVQLLSNLPDDWQTLFDGLVMPSAFIIHSQDEAEPHVHFLIDFNSPVRPQTVIDLIPHSFGVLHVEPVRNRNAYMRYMLHIGQENKYIYELNDLKLLHGCKFKKAEIFAVEFKDVYSIIEENNILNFAALLTCCMEHYPQCVDYIVNHSTPVRAYVRDRAYSLGCRS